MADKKISQLNTVIPTGDDLIAVVDNADPTITKKSTLDSIPKVTSVVGGTNITVDNTDPKNPIISAASSGVGDMTKTVYDPTNKNTDIFAYADTKVATASGSSIVDNIATFSSTDGKVIKDSGNKISVSASTNSVAKRDSYGALQLTNIDLYTTSTTTSATDLTLTATSYYHQNFIGTANQNVILPSSWFITGIGYEINNQSTGIVTIKSVDGSILTTLNQYEIAQCTTVLSSWADATRWSVKRLFVSSASSTKNGYLTATDWATFNGKQDTLTNASNIPANSIQLNTSPTGLSHSVGQFYYDSTNMTIALDLPDGVTLQIGEEGFVNCKNITGSTITNGSVVYVTGTDSGIPTIALANANSPATSNGYVAGIATQDILNNSVGKVTRQGIVRNINTSTFTNWQVVYLSDSVSGSLTGTPPTSPSATIKMGIILVSSATVGQIQVDINTSGDLNALSDVTITTPTTWQGLIYNGTNWINSAIGTSSAGSAVNFYYDDATIIPIGTSNTTEVNTLSKTATATAEVVDSFNCTNNTVIGEAYLYNTALNRTTIPSGTWTSNIYASVSSTAGGRVSTLTRGNYQVIIGTGTLTTTGSGTSRTATITGGTPFLSGDANATLTVGGYLQTPQGLYKITGFTSSSVVTIETPTTYINETSAIYNTWRNLFIVTSPAITTTGTNYSLYTYNASPWAFTINLTDKFGVIVFATSNNTTTVNFVHNGVTRNSYFSTPLTVLHNELEGINGGDSNVKQHLSLAEYNRLVLTTPSANTDIATKWYVDTQISPLPTATSTTTFTNKRITSRVFSESSNATPAINSDSYDEHKITALATAPTFGVPTGTPTDGQIIVYKILDNGTARALSWNAIYRAGTTIALPTTTTAGKWLYVGFEYNSSATKWDLLWVSNGF